MCFHSRGVFMRNMFKVVTVGVIALMLVGSPASAATTTSVNKKKITKIKTENKKKLKAAKSKHIKQNRQAKSTHTRTIKKLNRQKKATLTRIKTLNTNINFKNKNMHVAVPNSVLNKKPTHKNTISRTENLPAKLINPKIPNYGVQSNNAYYIYDARYDKTARISGNLSTAQQTEIADYTITLVNSVLQPLGGPKVTWSTQMQENMQTLSKERIKAKYVPTATHYEFAQRIFNNGNGVDYHSELSVPLSLAKNTSNKNLTMLQLKVLILNILTAHFYGNNPTNLLFLYYTGGLDYGVVLEKNLSPTSATAPYSILIGVGYPSETLPKKKLTYQQTKFASTYRKNVAPTKDLTQLKASKKNLGRLNRQINLTNINLKKKLKKNNANFNKAKQQANRVMSKKLRQL